MKLIKKRFLINDYVYDQHLIVYVGYTAIEVINKLKKNTKEDITIIQNNLKNTETGACYFRVPGIYESFIWIPEFDFNAELVSSLTHEVVHHVNNTLPPRGILLSKETDEVYAYYTAGIFKEILTKIVEEYYKINNLK